MLHIDGDIIAYRIACAVDEDATEGHVRSATDSFIALRCLTPFPELTPYQIYLTESPNDRNFRHTVAKTAPYKGFRGEKPPMLPVVRQHMLDSWDAFLAPATMECDDVIAMNVVQNQVHGSTTEVILSIDKDFDQIACDRYNFVTGKTTSPDAWEACKNVYKQILTGDAVDNIKGAEGCGDATASMLIDSCENEIDMWLICVDQMGYERALENAQLVYLLRHAFDYFHVPVDFKEIGEKYAWKDC